MDQSPDADPAGRFVERVAEGLARRGDVAEIRRLLLQRATTDGLSDRKLFIEVLLALDGKLFERKDDAS